MRTTQYKVGEAILVIHPEHGALAGVVERLHEEMVVARFKDFNGVEKRIYLDDELLDVNFERLWEYHQLLLRAINHLREGMELTMTLEECDIADQPTWQELLKRMKAEDVEEDMDRLFSSEQRTWWDKQIYRRPFDELLGDSEFELDDEEPEDEADSWKK